VAVLLIKVINCLKNWVRSLYPYDTEGMQDASGT